jgi:hypothetical protein
VSGAVSLTADGALSLVTDTASDALAEVVRRWQPGSAQPIPAAVARGARARIVVRELPDRAPEAASDPTEALLTFGDVTGFALAADRVRLLTPSRHTWTDLLLDAGRAEVNVGAAADAGHLAPMLTLASALLLGRMGRGLAHGASVVSPGGSAWLLVGDTHAGKTTTCATLLDGGWRYCSDDQVVVSRASDGTLEVEGWPRIFHLDAGFGDARPHGGRRSDVDAGARWPGRWVRRAPLAGVLFPVVDAGAATALLPIDAAGRLAGIVRQSPWLFADAGAAPGMLALLREMALLPGHALRLGRDSFARPERMIEVLATSLPVDSRLAD